VRPLPATTAWSGERRRNHGSARPERLLARGCSRPMQSHVGSADDRRLRPAWCPRWRTARRSLPRLPSEMRRRSGRRRSWRARARARARARRSTPARGRGHGRGRRPHPGWASGSLLASGEEIENRSERARGEYRADATKGPIIADSPKSAAMAARRQQKRGKRAHRGDKKGPPGQTKMENGGGRAVAAPHNAFPKLSCTPAADHGLRPRRGSEALACIPDGGAERRCRQGPRPAVAPQGAFVRAARAHSHAPPQSTRDD
jgi:hypothetical protein